MSHPYDTCMGLVSSLDWADKVSTTLTWYSHLCVKRQTHFCSCSLKSEHSLFVTLHRSSAADHPILLIREINHRKAIKPKTDVSRSERKHISVSRDLIVFLQLLGHVGFHFQPHIWVVSSHLNIHLRRCRKIKSPEIRVTVASHVEFSHNIMKRCIIIIIRLNCLLFSMSKCHC